MLRVLKITMLIVFLSLLCQPVWADDSYAVSGDEIIEYTAVGDNSLPPMVFINTKGRYDGYDVEYLRLLEQQGKMQFNIELMDWNDAKDTVRQGKADVLLGVVKTSERAQYLDFTEPYMEMRIVMFTQKNNFTIKKIDDLQNRRVGVQLGGLAEEFLRGHVPPLPIYSYNNQKAALSALKEGKVDAVVSSYFSGMYWINQYGWKDEIKVVGEPLFVNEYCLGVTKGNSELLIVLNQAIDTVRKTGQLKKLQDKWFGENYFFSTFINNSHIRDMIKWSLIVGILIFAFSALVFYSLHRKIDAATLSLREANEQLSKAYEVTIRAFFSALEKRESGTANHSLAVNIISLKIGHEMNLSQSEMLHLNWGTLLHDIGKLAISDTILLKEGPLTEAEYENIKRHPQIGYEILQGAEYLHEAAKVSLYHQERYDGTGYPNGLVMGEIPLLARICAVADAFEAMIADRPYRKGRSWQEAVVEIKKHSGSQFDPQVVMNFMRLDHSKLVEETRLQKL